MNMYKIDFMLEIKESDIKYIGLLWLKWMEEDDKEKQKRMKNNDENRSREDKINASVVILKNLNGRWKRCDFMT